MQNKHVMNIWGVRLYMAMRIAAAVPLMAATGAGAETSWWTPPGDVDRASLVTIDWPG